MGKTILIDAIDPDWMRRPGSDPADMEGRLLDSADLEADGQFHLAGTKDDHDQSSHGSRAGVRSRRISIPRNESEVEAFEALREAIRIVRDKPDATLAAAAKFNRARRLATQARDDIGEDRYDRLAAVGKALGMAIGNDKYLDDADRMLNEMEDDLYTEFEETWEVREPRAITVERVDLSGLPEPVGGSWSSPTGLILYSKADTISQTQAEHMLEHAEAAVRMSGYWDPETRRFPVTIRQMDDLWVTGSDGLPSKVDAALGWVDSRFPTEVNIVPGVRFRNLTYPDPMASTVKMAVEDYVVTHEMGHAILYGQMDDGPMGAAMDLTFTGDRLYDTHKTSPLLSAYGRTSSDEAHAEAFVEWVNTGGTTNNSVVRDYAAEFGWLDDDGNRIERDLVAAGPAPLDGPLSPTVPLVFIETETGGYSIPASQLVAPPGNAAEFHLAGTADDHDQSTHAGGGGGSGSDPRTEMPPHRPGEAPIPEGAVRLSHRTWTKNVDSILEGGLEQRDPGDGSGQVVWAAAGVGYTDGKIGDPWQAESDIAFFEFWMMPDELIVGNRQDPAWLEERSAHVTMQGVPPDRIVGTYMPWHAAVWAFESRTAGTFEEVKSGFYDNIGDDHPDTYGKAIEYIKANFATETFHLKGTANDHEQKTHGNRSGATGSGFATHAGFTQEWAEGRVDAQIAETTAALNGEADDYYVNMYQRMKANGADDLEFGEPFWLRSNPEINAIKEIDETGALPDEIRDQLVAQMLDDTTKAHGEHLGDSDWDPDHLEASARAVEVFSENPVVADMATKIGSVDVIFANDQDPGIGARYNRQLRSIVLSDMVGPKGLSSGRLVETDEWKADVGGSIVDVLRHEYGHAIETSLRGRRTTNELVQRFDQEWSDWADGGADIINLTGPEFMERWENKRGLSSYGQSNRAEGFAETFSFISHPTFDRAAVTDPKLGKMLDTMTELMETA